LTQASGLRVLLIEKGRDIDGRDCPARDSGSLCISCSPCNLVCGLGGAGAFSDGKLTLTWEAGGRLRDYLGEYDAESLIRYIDDVYLRFGAPETLYGVGDKIDEWRDRARQAGLRLTLMPVRHLGTERSRSVLKAMRDYLNSRLEFSLGEVVSTVVVDNGEVKGVETESGKRFDCSCLILAPGREGADWLSREAERLNLTLHNNPVDVGVRVEVPSAVVEELTTALYEAKLEFRSASFNDVIRTFCMCPGGEVILESTGGCDPVITVNGHSYADRGVATLTLPCW